MYAGGKGVPQSFTDAVSWFRKAAEQGHARGQFQLGIIYLNGWGVPPDRTEAINWFRRAAAKGDTDAVAALRKIGASQ
jgi:TPR repeat protein